MDLVAGHRVPRRAELRRDADHRRQQDGRRVHGVLHRDGAGLRAAPADRQCLGRLGGGARRASTGCGEIFALQPTILTPAAPKALPVPAQAADLVLDDVRFGYGDAPVLRGLSFTAEAGQTTALVGPSGAGKSTVFALLARLVEPQAGRVTIGGIAVAELPLAELRGLFSVVAQDALLFDETPAGEHPDGRRGRRRGRRCRGGATAAHVLDFADRLPHGLDTPAGPRGSALSGGQRQRVAIARALLRDRPILLLDEATSALDAAVGGGGAGGAGAAVGGAHDAGHRAPAGDGAGGGPDRGDGSGPGGGRRQPRRTAGPATGFMPRCTGCSSRER